MSNKGSCKTAACEKEVVGKGYCRRHYRQWKRGQMPKPHYKTCRTTGCRKRQARGSHCEEHQKVKAGAAASGGAAATTAGPSEGA